METLEKDRRRAHIQRMAHQPEMHLTPADFERAREIVAIRAPVTGDLADKATLAVAMGIAEGRAQGIKEGIKMVTASNDA